MNKWQQDIVDRIKTDTEHKRDTVLSYRESHIAMNGIITDAALDDLGVTIDDITALVRAESERRLYIAQYKKGDTVYRINTNKRDQRYGVHEEQITAVDVIVYVNGIIRPSEDLFHDKEAAEAALREEK